MMKKFFVIAGILLLWTVAATQSQQAERRSLIFNKAPVRNIQDPYPVFNGITMHEAQREVYLADENRGSLLTYNADFASTTRVVEPRRQIMGPKTHLGYICGVAISPEHNELFTVDNDWKDHLSVFPMNGKGEIAPKRELNIDHGAWGLFLEPTHDELWMTIQNIHKISVYRRGADGNENPLRFIHGLNTGLADPHGIFVDMASKTIFVSNHGFWRKTGSGRSLGLGRPDSAESSSDSRARPLVVSTGKFLPPSITVYAWDAQGDAKPLRTIVGPKTRLNLPLGIYLDTVSGQLAVANADNAVLFFDQNANGDVAPVRVIQGKSTGIDSPNAIYVDAKSNELWVTNRNHTATLYSRTAEGNVTPLRTLRSAPSGTPVTDFGNPSAVAYDSKRKEMLVSQ